MPFVGIRGASPLKDAIELRALLASLLRLENVGLLLGAGASVPAGGLTMAGLWRDFRRNTPESGTWLHDAQFIPFTALIEGADCRPPNVEELADAIEIALVEWTRTNRRGLKGLKTARADLQRAVVRAALLQPNWWTSIGAVENDFEPLQHHRSVLQKLIAARQPGQAAPWVFTTNYDLAVEWAAESIDVHVVDGFVGVHDRHFSPQSFDIGYRNTQARGEARFGAYNIYLSKLHGSLSWREEAGQVFELPAQLSHQYIDAFLNNGSSTELGLMVMPRAAKYIQTVGFVLGELFRRFSEFLARPQTSLLVCGYGFGDEHINRLLRSALLNPTLQLVVYFPGFGGNPAESTLPQALRKLLSLRNPRVTVIGGGPDAHIDKLANHLPDPVLFDQEMAKLAQQLRDAERDASGVHL